MRIDRAVLTGTVAKFKESGYNYLVKITAVDYGTHLMVLYFLAISGTGRTRPWRSSSRLRTHGSSA